MLTVLTWKWQSATPYRSTFGPQAVNTLRAMVARHYRSPHRFLCITDEREGIDPDIEIVPMFHDFEQVPSPHGGRNPSCYRRLRMFHPDFGQIAGPRFVAIDLDVVITRDLRPLWDRAEDFVMCGEQNPKNFYNGFMLLMTAGARPQVWTAFDPHRSPRASFQAGRWGSDQGWISHCLGPNEAKWTKADGLYSFRNDLKPRSHLPHDARMVIFHGRLDPWMEETRAVAPWITQHYHARPEMAVSA